MVATVRFTTTALLRTTARPAPAAAAARRAVCAAASSSSSPRVPGLSRCRTRHRQAVAVSAGLAAGTRCSSAGREGAVPGSRIWSFDEIKQLVAGGNSSEKIVIVDVREPLELQTTGKIPGAINIPVTSALQSFHVSDADFEDMHGFERPSRDATLLFYCKAGVRAKSAAGLAKLAGWENVGEYPGSWLDWEARKGPVERVKGGDGLGHNK
ncbi:Rhodanese domain protein [Metarhizium album ARSEF 1941]|uniref:Rhodanese domain protein n=1 Tax=Metarhizium album (strain ARSEF 1941) TaxID=1081103 RepID=A0A0B2WUY3_METAS|nr:Rhodanese domain protein [Metarhizium album ARSEF 1941]KHN97883.1 Rhodanese domain protein [Metarhizium album ARSEF 1941]